MTQGAKTLYTAKVHATGGREGAARSSDGRLDVRLSPPGAPGPGTNPEQMFAAGWAACFQGAMAIAARGQGVLLPPDLAVDAEVDLNLGPDGFALGARLAISLPGIDPDRARAIIDAAHATCPYSKAVQGNIEIAIQLVETGDRAATAAGRD